MCSFTLNIKALIEKPCLSAEKTFILSTVIQIRKSQKKQKQRKSGETPRVTVK
jgi:hypothetical protein